MHPNQLNCPLCFALNIVSVLTVLQEKPQWKRWWKRKGNPGYIYLPLKENTLPIQQPATSLKWPSDLLWTFAMCGYTVHSLPPKWLEGLVIHCSFYGSQLVRCCIIMQWVSVSGRVHKKMKIISSQLLPTNDVRLAKICLYNRLSFFLSW